MGLVARRTAHLMIHATSLAAPMLGTRHSAHVKFHATSQAAPASVTRRSALLMVHATSLAAQSRKSEQKGGGTAASTLEELQQQQLQQVHQQAGILKASNPFLPHLSSWLPVLPMAPPPPPFFPEALIATVTRILVVSVQAVTWILVLRWARPGQGLLKQVSQPTLGTLTMRRRLTMMGNIILQTLTNTAMRK